MLKNPQSSPDTTTSNLSSYYLMNEAQLMPELLRGIDLSVAQRLNIQAEAKSLVENIRRSRKARSPIDDLLQEYGLSTDEGVMLMRLSEALIRTPDFTTSRSLIRDKIGEADWTAHAGKSGSFLVNQATTGLQITAGWIAATGGVKAANLVAKLGDRVMDAAMARAMSVMGNHFVLGRNIEEACARGEKNERRGIAHSFDMLGEAAHTFEDADRYFNSYLNAINYLASAEDGTRPAQQRAGLSVKLSALHPRYEYAKRNECVPALTERLIEICEVAASAGLWLNIDAEEADRLELSLEIFERLLRVPSLADWSGLGMVVQAYQRRAIPALDHIHILAKSAKRKVSVRLVKGAYWDMEIKRAQELGLSDFPVFTRKSNTDVSYLSCASKLFNAEDYLFPQFATHNAHTAVAIAHMAGPKSLFEFQRLHGMGEALHDALIEKFEVQSRIYAPVGSHQDLLPYLVRRLLENGANGSFVNQMMDEDISADDVTADPISIAETERVFAHPKIRPPKLIAEDGREAAGGPDLTQSQSASVYEAMVASNDEHQSQSLVAVSVDGFEVQDIVSPQDQSKRVGTISTISDSEINAVVSVACRSEWYDQSSAQDRAAIILKAADLLEQDMQPFVELCIREAGKTLPDAIAEIREAVDFCRYYALQAQTEKIRTRAPLGVIACISPWNFPLAIFLGQIVAALSVGNVVIAKPAPQTPLIAAKAVELLRRAGIPESALQLVLGDGAKLGNALTRHDSVAGICFTGSTQTAKRIAINLSETGRADLPFIAETGGINAMIIDSTALLEQAVADVVSSAFQSAGQRCSACRIVVVQADIADRFVGMLKGAMRTQQLGDPARLATDIGPVIDRAAFDKIERYKSVARADGRMIAEIETGPDLTNGHFAGPALIEVDRISDVKEEVFGPVLHLARFESQDLDAVIDEINGLGFGLTLGLHTRLDERIEHVASRAHVGNLYVNRNQIGAVVGVHPFGGEGLSGTGPKAGGPHYLFALTKEVETTKPGARWVATNNATITPLSNGECLSNAKQAARSWQSQYPTPAERIAALQPDADFDLSALAYEETIQLPGPTGEQNQLRLVSREITLCFGGETHAETRRQVVKALISGSAVILVGDVSLEPPLPGLVQAVSLDQALGLIQDDIDSLVADGPIRKTVGAEAAQRSGPILPILSAHDPIERYLHERTLTINTTAAGGNASLLAMS